MYINKATLNPVKKRRFPPKHATAHWHNGWIAAANADWRINLGEALAVAEFHVTIWP